MVVRIDRLLEDPKNERKTFRNLDGLIASVSQAAMQALASNRLPIEMKPSVEGTLRATGQSTIENDAQKEAEQVITQLLGEETERGRNKGPSSSSKIKRRIHTIFPEMSAS